jgi:hypothetical protein
VDDGAVDDGAGAVLVVGLAPDEHPAARPSAAAASAVAAVFFTVAPSCRVLSV